MDWKIDVILSYGSQCKSAFRNISGTKNEIRNTGNPFYDSLLNIKKKRSEVLSSLGFRDNPSVFLVATSRIDPEEDVWIEALARLV